MSLRLSRSLRMKLLATAIAAVAFVLIYESVMMDSRTARLESASETAAPSPGKLVRFSATAYCKGEFTASGVRVRAGMVAADPQLLPVGSVIRVEGVPTGAQHVGCRIGCGRVAGGDDAGCAGPCLQRRGPQSRPMAAPPPRAGTLAAP